MPDRYAVIGHPIAHSKSPFIHGLFAQATGQDMVYEAIDGGAEPGGFERALAAFRAAGGRGMNVTLPFKLAALAAADAASEDARLAGAANTLSFEGGRIEARNTDGIGLVRDIEANLGLPLAGRRVLLLGAGGATRGAVRPIARAGAARIVIANRTADKAEALAAELAPHLGGVPLVGCGLAALGTQGAFDVVINATSASLDGQAPAVPAGAFAPGALAYDMVYGKGLTPFLRLARQAGCARLADGVGMLVEQAAEAFAAWRGVRPDTREALARLTVPLA
ncbi:MAG TPA: shikimate dehydrogenase [Ottowia sp.]|nr:shikimate dehydrogenase [Ottowia sp.]